MIYRIGHQVRYVTIIEANTPREALELAEKKPYEKWEQQILLDEDCVAWNEDPRNKHLGPD